MAEPKARKPRTPKPKTYSFAVALEQAKKLLGEKIDARNAAYEDAAVLNVEIAGLEATIRALNNQLQPGPVVLPPMTSTPSGPGNYIREIPEGAGSILVGVGNPPQQLAPDLDELPGMDGEFK